MAGATQYLTLVPDVRSDRAYTVSFDPAQLLGAAGQAFAVPPDLAFSTARRFVVLKATPPDGAQVPSVTRLQFTFSTPAAERASEVYGVSLAAAGQQLDIMTLMLSSDRRHCR